MFHPPHTAFRTKIAAICGVAMTGAMVFGAATAAAQPPPKPPNCTSADLAGIMSGVTAATSAYLFTHPDVNWYVTSLKGQPKDQIREQMHEYLNQHPQVRADFQGIRRPIVDFRNRCGLGST